MTGFSQIFERRGARGWVILTGESPAFHGTGTSILDALLRTESPEGALVILVPGGEIPLAIQPFVDEFRTQLGSGIKMVDPWEMEQANLLETCFNAQLVMAVGGSRDDWVGLFLEGRLPSDPDLIIDENSVFMAIGSLVTLLGEWTYDPDTDQISDGVGWFPRAIILLTSTAPALKDGVQQKIKSQTKSYALSLAPDTIIGVGVQGQIEIWSDVAPEILLGQGWA